jgi:hypothetical protein
LHTRKSSRHDGGIILRKLGVLVLLCIALPGCAGVGPNRLESDLLPYAKAISDSQKRQIPLNIVRLRYGDTPTFLSVNQVLSSYTLEQDGELGLDLFPNAREGNTATGLGSVTFSDRPTVTFARLSGGRLARSAVQPLSPAELLPLAQVGLPIDVLFRLGVQSIGPLRNTVSSGPLIAAFSQVSAEIEVPQADVEAGGTISSSRLSLFGLKPIISVHGGSSAPSDAETAVTYRGRRSGLMRTTSIPRLLTTSLYLMVAVVNAARAGQGPVLAVPTG